MVRIKRYCSYKVEKGKIVENIINRDFTATVPNQKTKDSNFDPPTKEELVENGQKNNLGVTNVTPRCVRA